MQKMWPLEPRREYPMRVRIPLRHRRRCCSVKRTSTATRPAARV